MTAIPQLLDTWRTTPPKMVKLGSIKRTPDFQPRKPELARFADRTRLINASEKHVEQLHHRLHETTSELDPVLLASFENALWLVDGHHRLMAYRRAARKTIPARIIDTDRNTALTTSKLVNCDGVKLPMHPDQLKEAAWQFLVLQSDQGRAALPQGLSLRAIGRLFGVSSSTMSRMHAQLQLIKPADFPPVALDSGTYFPLWKYVKGNAIRDRLQDVPEDKLLAQLACKISALIEKHSLDSMLSAIKLLKQEALIDAVEELAKIAGDGDELTDY